LLAVLLSAAIVCFAVLFLGQATLRLLGAAEWSWLAPAVGLSVAALVAASTIYLPGRATTMAVLLAVLSVAAAIWCLRAPPHRPSLVDVLSVLPVAALAIVPFLAAGRAGIIGVTVNNDTAPHLMFAVGVLSEAAESAGAIPADYPLGPHSIAAALSQGLGIHLELALSGLTLALPLITAWTALMATREGPWFGKPIVATVVGFPFLVAAYYGEGAFKEVAQAAFVLAIVLSLGGFGPSLRARWRWVPLALLTGGIISVYSPAGLLWPVAIVGVWLAGLLVTKVWRGQLAEVVPALRREVPAVAIAGAALLVALLPQAKRMWEFVAVRDQGTGIPVDSLGNLVGPLPVWQVLGTWNNADFRLPASPEFSGGKWSIFVLVLIAVGTVWALRRGRWLLPAAAAAAMAIWAYSEQTQSPYVTAKALVIASPLLLLLAVLPLAEGTGADRRLRWPWIVLAVLCFGLFLRIGKDDLRAMRFSPVAPAGLARQLETFRPVVEGERTLFLGEDEYIRWQLAGALVDPVAVASAPALPLRDEKGWEDAEAIDFDTVRASTLNDYEYVVGYRDAAASAAHAQYRLVGTTQDYALWKRTGKVPERMTLEEGEWPGATLECDTPAGRRILAAGGVAAVRRPPFRIPLPEQIPAGESFGTSLDLPPGTWQLQMPYISPYPIEVRAPGLRRTLPASLSRVGPRLPVGRVTARAGQSLPLSLQVEDQWLSPPTAVAFFAYMAATPLGESRVVPVAKACGRYVDWYRPAS
jgi:hypothetical protein